MTDQSWWKHGIAQLGSGMLNGFKAENLPKMTLQQFKMQIILSLGAL
jgi:hypothetical protein